MKKKNTHNDLGFKVPDGYFESNMDRLFDKVNPAQESKELPFSVPSGYFETLEDRIIDAVSADQNKLVSSSNPFEVPQGYFESLEDRVMSTVAQSKQITLDKENPFTNPEHYFESLEQRVLEATVDKPVVKLERDYPSWVIPMIAIAAIFVAILAIDGFWNSNTFSLDDLDNEEIAIYLSNNDQTFGQETIDILYSNNELPEDMGIYNSLSDEALLDYLIYEVDMDQMIEE